VDACYSLGAVFLSILICVHSAQLAKGNVADPVPNVILVLIEGEPQPAPHDQGVRGCECDEIQICGTRKNRQVLGPIVPGRANCKLCARGKVHGFDMHRRDRFRSHYSADCMMQYV